MKINCFIQTSFVDEKLTIKIDTNSNENITKPLYLTTNPDNLMSNMLKKKENLRNKSIFNFKLTELSEVNNSKEELKNMFYFCQRTRGG